MLILVDVDSVVADLIPAWLSLYNEEYNDDLSSEKLVEWDMTKFVKAECGTKIYEYLKREDLYDLVKPIDGALSGVKHLRRNGHRVVYASAGVYSAAKFRWLNTHGFEPGKFAEDYVVIYDKSLLKGDLLIDDRVENVEKFGIRDSILFDQPWNQASLWSRRAFTWHDVTLMVSK